MTKINSIQSQGGKNKMTFTPTEPDYSGDGVAIWKAVDKNGKSYLKVKVLGHNVNCFSVEKKKE